MAIQHYPFLPTLVTFSCLCVGVFILDLELHKVHVISEIHVAEWQELSPCVY